MCSCWVEGSGEKQKERVLFTHVYFITRKYSFSNATAREKSRTKKEPYSTLLSPWKARSLARWIAHVHIILCSTKPSLFLCPVKRKKKSITTGRTFLPIHKMNILPG